MMEESERGLRREKEETKGDTLTVSISSYLSLSLSYSLLLSPALKTQRPDIYVNDHGERLVGDG